MSLTCLFPQQGWHLQWAMPEISTVRLSVMNLTVILTVLVEQHGSMNQNFLHYNFSFNEEAIRFMAM